MLFGLWFWLETEKLLFIILWSKSEGLAVHGGMDGGRGIMKGHPSCTNKHKKVKLVLDLRPQEGPLDDCGVLAQIRVMETGQHNKTTMNIYVLGGGFTLSYENLSLNCCGSE